MAKTKRKSHSPPERRGPRTAVHDLVYQQIRQSLMVGTFAPGEKVSLRSLAEQVATSLTPVRSAVNRLIAEGAFAVLPNRWIVIPPMTEEKFDEITYWRVQLETEATRRACRNCTPELIETISKINEAMIKAVQSGANRKSVLSANYDFHFTLYRAARSTILLPMIESLWLQIGPFTYYSLLSPREVWNAKFHRDLIDALKARDAKAAAKAIENDIQNTADFLRRHGDYGPPKLQPVTV